MNEERLILQIRELCISPRPEAWDDEPASHSNESRGIPRRPAVLYREMDLDLIRGPAVIPCMDLLQTSRELSICIDTASCSRDPSGNKEVFSLENGRARACCQVFLKKRDTCENVSGGSCKYGGTSHRYFDYPAILFIFSDPGISVHDGALFDRFVVRGDL